jgi:hypothetical protein
MKIVITENQYNLLLEQPNVYTDINEYKKALKIYNKKMAIYQMSLELYKERAAWSKDFDNNYRISFSFLNKDNLVKLTDVNVSIFLKDMDNYYRCKNNLLDHGGFKMGNNCVSGNYTYKKLVNPKINKWNEVPTDSNLYKSFWIPIFEKPNLQKPIFKKPEPVVKPTPPVTKTPPVINYRELKSQLTFAPQFKTGTPVIELNIPGGPYYLTYPEFEIYKKTRPNTTFKKT